MLGTIPCLICRRERFCKQRGKIPQYPAGKKIWSRSFGDINIRESTLNVLCIDYILATVGLIVRYVDKTSGSTGWRYSETLTKNSLMTSGSSLLSGTSREDNGECDLRLMKF